MSDFDAVLERLVTDPAFKSALAADPAAALAGYRLSGDEVELLRSQVAAGDAGERTVETRTSKASMMGLLGQFGGMGLGGHAATEPPVTMGRGITHEHFGPKVTTGLEPLSNPPDQGHYGGLGERAAWMGPGDAGQAGQHYGPSEAGATGAEGAVPGAGDQPATGYHPHIDADGDGKWDKYAAIRHVDGSVDVYEDRNRDGLIDFIGHDRNGNGILESADYDENFDGATDTHMADVDGDGWMDTRGPATGR